MNPLDRLFLSLDVLVVLGVLAIGCLVVHSERLRRGEAGFRLGWLLGWLGSLTAIWLAMAAGWVPEFIGWPTTGALTIIWSLYAKDDDDPGAKRRRRAAARARVRRWLAQGIPARRPVPEPAR